MSKNVSNGRFPVFWAIFLGPILLWVCLFKDFLNGPIVIMKDTYSIYGMFKFFYNNLFNGVVPLWDPFVKLGMPYISIANSGVLSPLMALFGSLHFLGVNYYVSFILFILFYFILGLGGFYLLALEVLGDRFYAWLSFVALLFSGMGPMLFNQLFVYFIFCPAVWMLYFLFRFSRTFDRKYFLGMTAALANMFCFYIPFYFLTLFLFFAVLMVFLYPFYLKAFASGLTNFILRNKKTFFGCALFFVFALMPLIFFKVSLNGADILFLSRRASSENVVISEKELGKDTVSAMTFNEVSLQGTLGERINAGRLFSNLDKYYYVSDDFFYIPLIIYLIIFITIFNYFERRQFLILCLGLGLFLLSLGQAAPLHRILYDTIFYFKYFRNFFFFSAFLIPLIILFAAFRLKELFDSSKFYDKRWRNVFLNTFLHLVFLGLLFWQGDILMTSYLTVILSCIFFNILFFQPRLSRILLFLILLLEPFQVFTSFGANTLGFRFSPPADHSVPLFNYQRPSLSNRRPFPIFPEKEDYGDVWYDLTMKDSKGYIPGTPMIVTKFTYLLSKTLDENIFLNYICHKFYVYDRVRFLKDYSDIKMAEVFKNNENLALVAQPLEDGAYQEKIQAPAVPLIVTRDSDNFKVLDFNPNRIRLMTDFNAGKFLVYTDSFEKYWKVLINGHEQKLYRANTAFKGVWVPAGKNEVIFQYSIMGEKELYLLLLLFNCLFLIYFLRIICIRGF